MVSWINWNFRALDMGIIADVCRVGQHEMSTLYFIAALVTLGLVIYLFWALMQPEVF